MKTKTFIIIVIILLLLLTTFNLWKLGVFERKCRIIDTDRIVMYKMDCDILQEKCDEDNDERCKFVEDAVYGNGKPVGYGICWCSNSNKEQKINDSIIIKVNAYDLLEE